MLSELKTSKKMERVLLAYLFLFISIPGFCQQSADGQLDKMPPELEKDFALSSLPLRLRNDATVYLLDPQKGYYIARKGSNGFVCFVTRTEWEWGKFRKDVAAAISYDAEGARTIFKVYQDVAAMRASGKYSALQIKNIVLGRIRKGIYKAPARPGISYMLAPVMRAYPGNPDNDSVMTMIMPHYMFYAPYLTNTDIGGSQEDWPVVINPGATLLGERKGPFGYIILPAGKTERATIIHDSQELLKRLKAYKSYFAIAPGGM
jgi:hypothetical protein